MLGAVAVAFGGDGDFLGSRTARRLYAGQPTTDAHRRRLFAAVAGLLVDAGVVETSDVLRRGDVARALGQAPLRWDRILGRLESRAGPVGGAVAERALRLAAVDLAIRRCYAMSALAERERAGGARFYSSGSGRPATRYAGVVFPG
ncbi:MAG: hypothetical protein OXG72_15025 [Acidobacteria bacterium]|nr:hypothetical protein [Acidobacteriota bacterium]